MNRRTTLAGLGLAAVLTLAACGAESSDDTTDANASTTPSVETNEEAAASGDADELFTAMQAAQQEKQTVVASMVTDAAGMSITGGGSLRFAGSVAADMTIEVPLDASGQPQQMRIIILDGSVYMQIPGLSDSMPGKSWIAATGDGTDPFSQAMAPVLDQLSSSLDPSLEMYAHGAELTESGTETVDGVETTKYVGSVDLEAALAELDGSLAESAQSLIDAGSSDVELHRVGRRREPAAQVRVRDRDRRAERNHNGHLLEVGRAGRHHRTAGRPGR